MMLQLIILLSIGALTALDQWLKHLAVVHLKEQPPFVLIDGVFEFHYRENAGAAFGILQNQRWIFMSVTIVVMVFLLVLLMSGKFRRYPWLNVSGILIVAGGIGNLIDRIFNGYVVDFLYFKLINFPIFNFADCCVVIGAAALLIFFFFFYDEKPLLAHGKSEKPLGEDLTEEAALFQEEMPPDDSPAQKEGQENGGETLDGPAGEQRRED